MYIPPVFGHLDAVIYILWKFIAIKYGFGLIGFTI